MGKNMRVAVRSMDGQTREFKTRGCLMLTMQKSKVGVMLAGELEAVLLGKALVGTIDTQQPGSAEENLLLTLVITVCREAVRNERVVEAMRFQAETAALVRDLLGDTEGGEDDE